MVCEYVEFVISSLYFFSLHSSAACVLSLIASPYCSKWSILVQYVWIFSFLIFYFVHVFYFYPYFLTFFSLNVFLRAHSGYRELGLVY